MKPPVRYADAVTSSPLTLIVTVEGLIPTLVGELNVAKMLGVVLLTV